jgi:hypothetical protein
MCDGCYLEEEMDVKDHEAIFDASCCEHRNRNYIVSVWLKIAKEMGIGK